MTVALRKGWRADAECQGQPGELFFDERFESSAKTYCHRCSVRDECLEYAYRHRILHGIWGGLTPRERKRAARRRVSGAR